MSAPTDDEPPVDMGGAGLRGGGADVLPPSDDEEPVGYGKPPRRHRFKPGQSGNVRGRPRGAKGLRTILENELNTRVRGTVNGRRASMSKLQYIVRQVVEKAMAGDHRAIQQLITLNITMFGLGEAERPEEAPLTEGEIAFIEALNRNLPAGDQAAGHVSDPGALSDIGEVADDE